jgi:hypothetical protein
LLPSGLRFALRLKNTNLFWGIICAAICFKALPLIFDRQDGRAGVDLR